VSAGVSAGRLDDLAWFSQDRVDPYGGRLLPVCCPGAPSHDNLIPCPAPSQVYVGKPSACGFPSRRWEPKAIGGHERSLTVQGPSDPHTSGSSNSNGIYRGGTYFCDNRAHRVQRGVKEGGPTMDWDGQTTVEGRAAGEQVGRLGL
jgi:hypothetical protein